MRVRIHDDVADFLAAADAFLRSDPFTTSVIAGVAQRAAQAPRRRADCLWVTVEDGDAGVLGVAMHTPPFPAFLSRMPTAAAAALADGLLEHGRELPGINGVRECAEAFGEAWTKRTGRGSTVVYSMRMYALETLSAPEGVSGHASLAATADDAKLLVEWFDAFHGEALSHSPSEDSVAIVERRIAARELHLWRDADAAVSVASVTAPAAGVARIGPVYTPPSARRRGYGAAVTAAASAAALKDGAEHVVLYADMANPTSNAIYQAIGFRFNHDGESRLFDGAPGASGSAAG